MQEALLALDAERFVLDGELIVAQNQTLSFDDLLQRIHPAASRIKKLSTETPATLLVFDILVGNEGNNLTERPLKERRQALETFAERFFPVNLESGFHLAPITSTSQRTGSTEWPAHSTELSRSV